MSKGLKASCLSIVNVILFIRINKFIKLEIINIMLLEMIDLWFSMKGEDIEHTDRKCHVFAI